MNRQNFLGHLILALSLIVLATFIGQMRHWHKRHSPRSERGVSFVKISTEAPKQTISKKAEALVRFRSGVTLAAIKEIAAAHNDRVEDQLEEVEGIAVIEDEDGETAERVAAEYNALSGDVEYAEPSYEINLEPEFSNSASRHNFISEHTKDAARDSERTLALSAPNDPMFGEQWSLENTGQREGKSGADISAAKAWAKTHGSRDVVIAVLDSGVDYTHSDLIHNMWTRPANISAYTDDQLGLVDDVHGYNAVNNSGDPMDDNGHGTHCAGIIGAEADNKEGIAGVDWQVEIMPLKFMSAGGFGTTKDAIECINYVINRKHAGVNVRVISASWGSTAKSKALEDAIRKASEEGILFVAASGNAGQNGDKSPHYPAGYDLPNMLSIAALDRNDELASFSNYGAKSVHLAAPGVDILSTWLNNSFEEHSGTSMATPEVAGVAGLVLANEPNISMKDLRERLLNSVDPLPSLKGKVSTGGRLNAARAVGAE